MLELCNRWRCESFHQFPRADEMIVSTQQQLGAREIEFWGRAEFGQVFIF